MSLAIIDVRRVPKPGKSKEVLEAAKASFENTGKHGLVSITSAGPLTSPRSIMTSIFGPTLEECEAFQDSVVSSDEILNRLMAIDALCDLSASTILNVVELAEGMGDLKFINRRFLKAKRGHVGELLDALIEWRGAFKGAKPQISVPIAGDIDLIRVTMGGESLTTLGERINDVATNPDYGKYRSKVASATVSANSFISRVITSNLP